MKTVYVGLIVILVILSGIVFYSTTIPIVEKKSTLIISVKDVPKQSKHGIISSLILTFSEVSVHKASTGEMINKTTEEMSTIEFNETKNTGWIKVVDKIQTIDLMEFTEVDKILGQKILDPGKYTQIRLKIDSGTVIIDGETYDLKIPSKFMKLNRGFELETNVDLKLILDFNVEKSLVETGQNNYILKPVIAVISEIVETTTLKTTIVQTTVETTIQETTTPSSILETTTVPVTGEGVLVMKIKDKLDLTNVTVINITIDKVEVHKTGTDEDETESNETFETNNTSSAGWTIILDETKSYNLLDLVNTPGEVMGEKTLSAGKYTQIRLSVSKTELTLDNKTYDVKVPSKRFYWIKPFYIESGKTTTLTLDFEASDSIKETGKNKFILKPVVKIISEISETTTTIETTSTTSTSTSITSTTIINTTSTSTINTTSTSSTIETTINTTSTTIPENTTTTIV